MGIHRGPLVKTEGLISAFDDGATRCHSGTSSTASDIIDSTSWTLNGTFTRDSDGFLYYNGTNCYMTSTRSYTDQADLTTNITSSGTGGGQEEYTLECWMRIPNDVPGDTTLGWQLVGNNSSLGVGIQLMYNTSGNKINFGYRTNSNVYGTTNLAIDTWYHIVGTRIVESTTAYHRIYVNGVQDYQGTGDTTLDVDANTSVMHTGRTAARITGWFKGNMPVVRIYNTGMTPAEVTANFNAQKSRFGL